MTEFSRKAIRGTETLGEKLRRLREEAQMSLEEFANRTGIQLRYLALLEAGRYDRLPGEAYVRRFLRSYAETLHLSMPHVFSIYERERQIVPAAHPAQVKPPQALPEPHARNWPRVLQRAGILAGTLALLVYLGFKVLALLTPPSLQITSPASDMVTNDLSIVVNGTTEQESRVRINGQQVFTDSSGHFSERIDLQPGVNVIKVSAAKERSREQVVYRQVVVNQQSEGGSS